MVTEDILTPEFTNMTGWKNPPGWVDVSPIETGDFPASHVRFSQCISSSKTTFEGAGVRLLSTRGAPKPSGRWSTKQPNVWVMIFINPKWLSSHYGTMGYIFIHWCYPTRILDNNLNTVHNKSSALNYFTTMIWINYVGSHSFNHLVLWLVNLPPRNKALLRAY